MTAPDDPLLLRSAPFHLDEQACAWVSSTREAMTLEQKVGQLFCLINMSGTTDGLDADFAVAQPGGVMHRPGPSEKIVEINRHLQERVDVPLLIAANLETGADGLACDRTSFGSPLQVAAGRDDENAYRMGLVCGREARALGCTWGFAPIVDIQVNHANPITLTRSFGSDPELVALLGAAFVRGLQESGVAAAVKHWPGDGVDDRDQHLLTTVNTLSVDKWESTFGQVYRTMAEAGALSVMAAHIALPEYSRTLRPGVSDADILPASLAPEITTDLLRGRLGFKGLVVTDASVMGGIQSMLPRQRLVPLSIAAGCDMFLFVEDYAEDFGYMLDGVRRGVITAERLDEAVTRVLAMKASLGLHRATCIEDLVPDAVRNSDTEPLVDTRSGITPTAMDLGVHQAWARASADAAVTLVKDGDPRALPLDPAHHRRVLVYSLRGPGSTWQPVECFRQALAGEGFAVHVMCQDGRTGTDGISYGQDGAVIGRELRENFDVVIYLLDVWPVSNEPTPRLYWSAWGRNVPKYTAELPTIAISLGSPFHLQDMPRVKTFINAYARNDATVVAVVDKLLGRSAFTGVSPVDPFCGYWDARL